MLSIRQFDNAIHASMTLPGLESQLREHGAGSMVLDFRAQANNSLPPFIASFANPVHVDSAPPHEADPDALADDGCEWREDLGVAALTGTASSC